MKPYKTTKFNLVRSPLTTLGQGTRWVGLCKSASKWFPELGLTAFSGVRFGAAVTTSVTST